MLRAIFDTNIYGKLIKEKDFAEIESKIIKDKEFIIYGYRPIRKEIRNIPKETKLSKKTRNFLLSLYDNITGKHLFENSIKIITLAKQYYEVYRDLGGIYGWHTNIKVDFMIVACASIYALDIIYSADNKTLLNKYALESYKQVNYKENLRTPNLLKYSDLLKKIRR